MSPKLRLIICNESADRHPHAQARLFVVEPAPVEETEAATSQTDYRPPKRQYKMLPALLGVFLALFFQFLVHRVYESPNLRQEAWIDVVTWALIMAGMTLSVMSFLEECLACRISQSMQMQQLASRLCKGCR